MIDGPRIPVGRGCGDRPQATVSNVSGRQPRIVDCYEQYLADENLPRLVAAVRRWYTIETLERLAVSGPRMARRAAVLVLGQVAQYGSNAVLGRALVDSDRGVRMLADASIRKVWCRVGAPGQRRLLRAVIRHNHNRQHAEAVRKASQLIQQSPWLAEAWFQRGLAYLQLSRTDMALEDLQQTLEINPYHFRAAAAMGRAFLEEAQPAAALEAFRRALRLNPDLVQVRAQVVRLRRSLSDGQIE